MSGSMTDRTYRNLLVECGYDAEAVGRRLKAIVDTMFFGDEDETIYGEFGDVAYVTDTGNHDVRSEGMSYAMMVFVQLDMKEHFDKIWRFCKKYMFLTEGPNKGYFAWSVGLDGEKFSDGPAPDGEEFFAMALFFASHRWGDGEGILDYAREAKDLLSVCIHKGEDGIGHPMWNPENKLIKFVPGLEFSDPSYHLPHFYELFALWAYEEDRDYWSEAAQASRDYLKKACHPVTGLAAEYANYDGTPNDLNGHDKFYSDSYRVAANIGLYHEWFGDDEGLCDCVARLQHFFKQTVPDEWDYIYEIDGSKVNEKVLHPVGLIAANAMGSLATLESDGSASDRHFNALACLREFYETPLRSGERRYYDNFLYLFAFMALSGNYRVYYK